MLCTHTSFAADIINNYNLTMMRNLSLKTCKQLSLLIFCALLILAFLPLPAFAAERYQILKIGDRDDYVLALQNKLIELGFFSGTATGYFGTRTQQAVIDYQTAHDLTADGKAGPETLASIMGKDFKIERNNRTYTSDDTDANCPVPGDKGTSVSEIQNKLKELDYYSYPSITGYYGPVTEQAVRLFQSMNGLKADGITGAETMALLHSDTAKSYCISYGEKSSDVQMLQLRLIKLGYLKDTAATGYFGTMTLHAIKEFQARNGLSVDAKVGKETRAKLYSDTALDWDGNNRVTDETPVHSKSSTATMLDYANAQLGKPYVYDAEGPDAFDGAGFVSYVLRCSGFSVKRSSASGLSKSESWTKISQISALVPGDLLFFQSDLSQRINHTGIYLGGNLFIHASSSDNCVTVSDLSDYYLKNFNFARRLF